MNIGRFAETLETHDHLRRGGVVYGPFLQSQG
jgi:hypothetical protein